MEDSRLQQLKHRETPSNNSYLHKLEDLLSQQLKRREIPSNNSDLHKKEAIAITRKLTNPLGKHWNAHDKRDIDSGVIEQGIKIKTNTSQSINSDVNEEHSNTYQNSAITQNMRVKQTDKIKTNTWRDERDTGPPVNPQVMCELPVDKEPLNQFALRDPQDQTQYYHNEMFTQDNGFGIKGQLSHKLDSSEEPNTLSPPIIHDPFSFDGSNKGNLEQRLPP